MDPSQCLCPTWMLQLPCCCPPAPKSPDVSLRNLGQTRLSWSNSAQIRTEPIDLNLWWWTTLESDFPWVWLYFDLKPVSLHLLYEETEASLWSFALWEEYLRIRRFLCVYYSLTAHVVLVLLFSGCKSLFTFCKKNWLEVTLLISFYLISFHMVLTSLTGCSFMSVIAIFKFLPWLISVSTTLIQTIEIWGNPCQK